MKDCGLAIRKGYFDKLTSESFSLGVYDTIAPDNVNPPFLIISSQTAPEDSDKQSYSFNATIQFDIIYKTQKSGEVGQKSVDEWANELLEIIGVYPIDYPSVAPNFNIVTRKMGANYATFDYIDQSYVFRRIITMEHFVTQLL
jgi:hypothetical protein